MTSPYLEFDALLVAALPLNSLFAVGGRVRDEIRAAARGAVAHIKDADYVVVGVDYDELERRVAHIGSVDRVGASFSVLKLTRQGVTIDLALPRREASTGAGHREFRIESGPEVSLVDDLARRDFRMNMIARALPCGDVIDPYGGTADILAQQIDLLREEAFIEDPLRMLRACQFGARFRYELTPRTMLAMQQSAHLIGSVSPQRIGEEISKFMQIAHQPSLGIEFMRLGGILSAIWPELLEGVGVEQNDWHLYDVYRHNLETLDATPTGDLVLRLAALLHDIGKPRTKDGPHFYRHEFVGEELARAMLMRTAFPHEIIERVCALVRHHMYCVEPQLTEAALRRFIRRVGTTSLDHLFALRAADIRGSGLPKRSDENQLFQARIAQEILQQPALSLRDLPIKGQDVMMAFATAGVIISPHGDRRIGEALNFLLEFVTDHPDCNTREVLNVHLDTFIISLKSPT